MFELVCILLGVRVCCTNQLKQLKKGTWVIQQINVLLYYAEICIQLRHFVLKNLCVAGLTKIGYTVGIFF